MARSKIDSKIENPTSKIEELYIEWALINALFNGIELNSIVYEWDLEDAIGETEIWLNKQQDGELINQVERQMVGLISNRSKS